MTFVLALLWALVFWTIGGFAAFLLKDLRKSPHAIWIFSALVGSVLAGLGALPFSLMGSANPALFGAIGLGCGFLLGAVGYNGLRLIYAPSITPEQIEALQSRINTLESEQQTGHPQLFILDKSTLYFGDIVQFINAVYFNADFFIPRFVVAEVQAMVNSEDPLTHSLGDYSLKTIERLYKESALKVQVYEDNIAGNTNEEKMINLIRELNAHLITALPTTVRNMQSESLPVVFLPAVRPLLKPNNFVGETLTLNVVEAGQEDAQGVGYLEDGTKVIIEGGAKFVGRSVETRIQRIYETVAGQMIWATIE